MTARFALIQHWFMRALAAHLARPLTSAAEVTPPLPTLLHRGDVLLSNGNTRAAALVRCLTRSPWTHVSMYVGPVEEGPDPPCIVEADIAAGVRTIRLSELNALQVRVLRPLVSDEEQSRVAQVALGCVGAAYDHRLAWRLAASLLRHRTLPQVADLATVHRFICCTLVAHAFTLIGHHLPGLVPRDFERIPLFEKVSGS